MVIILNFSSLLKRLEKKRLEKKNTLGVKLVT